MYLSPIMVLVLRLNCEILADVTFAAWQRHYAQAKLSRSNLLAITECTLIAQSACSPQTLLAGKAPVLD